jgi:hypothetical protein
MIYIKTINAMNPENIVNCTAIEVLRDNKNVRKVKKVGRGRLWLVQALGNY